MTTPKKPPSPTRAALRELATWLGARGGASTSPAKARAARSNGAKGGRPSAQASPGPDQATTRPVPSPPPAGADFLAKMAAGRIKAAAALAAMTPAELAAHKAKAAEKRASAAAKRAAKAGAK